MTERILVIGGKGDMGKLVVRKSQELGHQTQILDPRSETQPDPNIAIGWATVIYCSLFPEDFQEFIDQHGEKITPDQKLIEGASTKREIMPLLEKIDKQGVSTCSVHHLAKHDQPIRGVKVLIMPVGDNSADAEAFAKQFYNDLGMTTVNFALKDHDRIMAPNQLEPHLSGWVHARTLQKLGFPFGELWGLAPANTELFLASIARTSLQKPRISSTIIRNHLRTPEGRAIVEGLLQSIQEIVNAANEEDEAKLTEMLTETSWWIENDTTGREMNERTTVILERLANLRLQSLSVISPKDEPGVLRAVTGIFTETENDINLTAVDSHVLDGGVKFMIGVDLDTDEQKIEDAISNLRELGFTVEEIRNG